MATMSKNLSRSPLHLLHRAVQAVEMIYQGEVGAADLTSRQLAVLITVAEKEGLSRAGIVTKTGIDRSTMAGIVQRLTKKGLLQQRDSKEDGRAYVVSMTNEGRKTLRKIGPLVNNVDQRILAVLREGDDFLDRLQAIVEKLRPAN